MFTLPALGAQIAAQVIEQQKAGQWVNEWWENGRKLEMKKDLTRTGRMRCTQRLTYYSHRLSKKPDSEYYKRKIDKWVSKCSVAEQPLDDTQK